MERSRTTWTSPLPRWLSVLCVMVVLLTYPEINGVAAAKTCHCTESQQLCSNEGTCESPLLEEDFSCLVSRQYDDALGIHRVFQQCILGPIDYGIFCNSPSVDGLVIFDRKLKLSGEIDICCFTDKCNSEALLMELVTNRTATSTTPSPVNKSVTTVTPPNTKRPSEGEPSTEAPTYAVVVIAALSTLVVIILIVIIIALYLHYRGYPLNSPGTSSGTPTIAMTVDSGSYGESSLNELLEDSGSGSGLPLLIQRSIAGQIALHELIGKGRFGEVWKGTYKGDEVAVKIFHTKEESSWFHEVELYQTCLIRHPNILRFIAADNKDIGIQMQLWLITEFCKYGSLYDLLIQRTLDEEMMLKLSYTAACGLDHLHAEVVGTEGKPAIAHRDLKSRNILVKGDFSCCIADLGLALRYRRDTDTVEDLPSKRVGTKRYLAPEIIDESISFKSFEAYKQADMYSFGLVLWEITRRGECGGHYEEAQLPYYDVVPMDPSFEDMKKAVVIDKRRPVIPNQWSQSEVFRGMAKLIQQCWLEKSEARLTTLRLKKNLANLQNSKDGKSKKEENQEIS